MFRPYYRIHTAGGPGTHFEKEDVMNPIQAFLKRHDIPPEIVTDVRMHGNSIYVIFAKGSIKQHENNLKAAFDPLKTAKFSYSLLHTDHPHQDDWLLCWVPFLEDIVEANNIFEFQARNKSNISLG